MTLSPSASGRIARTLRKSMPAAAISLLTLSCLSLPALAQQAAPATPAVAAAAPAAAGTPVVYSASQGRQGMSAYAANCAACHGDVLQGQLDAPPLQGPNFQAKWFGQPVSTLYEFITTNMPQDRPGALDPKTYAQITSFLLKRNGVAASTDDAELPLPGDASLATLMLPAANPDAAK